MSEVTLSDSTRTVLLSLQRTGALINRTQDRLATGLKVGSPLDDAQAFFVAKGLTDRANDLLEIKDSIDLAASTLGAAVVGIEGITELLDQMKALALTAKGVSNSEARDIAADFDVLRSQVDSLAGDASFNAVNLIASSPDDLTVVFNEDGSSTLTISGEASDASSLGVGTGDSDYDDFRDNNDVDDAVDDINAALDTLRATASTLESNNDLIGSRLAFTEGLINTLFEGAGKLVNVDLNEEAANLVALQVRHDLGVLSLQSSAETQQALFSLL